MKLGFTINFLSTFIQILFEILPLVVTLIAAISGMSIWIGRREGWSMSDCLYFGFITATTVGYGDYRPKQAGSKYMAIIIALFGMILTGILIAVAVESVGYVYKASHFN